MLAVFIVLATALTVLGSTAVVIAHPINDFVTGGGWIPIYSEDCRCYHKAAFALGGGCKHGGFWGHFEYVDHSPGAVVRTVHATEITGYFDSGPPASPTLRVIKGTAEINGVPDIAFEVDVDDKGEPGREDHFYIHHEAHCLAYRVSRRWEPPAQPDAEVETVEAGILHSPAIGVLMDIYPAIRVIYKPRDSRYGQKPVNYYDRHGKPVPVPRIAIMPEEARRERDAPKQQ